MTFSKKTFLLCGSRGINVNGCIAALADPGKGGGDQGRRIRGFEGARAPPEHESAPSHCQKHPLKMKEKLDEMPFQIDIQQNYGCFDVHIRLLSV